MEIIRIGDNKLKLILNDEDLEKYNLKFESLDYDNTKTRRVLWSILDDAKQKTGFDAAAERTLVQAYPGRKGGCEIYVTRQDAPRAAANKRVRLYRFSDSESLFSACHALFLATQKQESELYLSADDTFYLKIHTKEGESGTHGNLLSSLSFLEEYAIRGKCGALCAYIEEHGTRLIAHDAIEKIAAFFVSE